MVEPYCNVERVSITEQSLTIESCVGKMRFYRKLEPRQMGNKCFQHKRTVLMVTDDDQTQTKLVLLGSTLTRANTTVL